MHVIIFSNLSEESQVAARVLCDLDGYPRIQQLIARAFGIKVIYPRLKGRKAT